MQELLINENGYLDDLIQDGRGGQHNPIFYDYFPEMEDIIKLHVEEKISKKDCSFNSQDLAKFVSKEF